MQSKSTTAEQYVKEPEAERQAAIQLCVR